MSNYLTAGEQLLPAKRFELIRVAGIVNQLNLTDARINREKTAKLLSFLSGKPVDQGRISTNGDLVQTNFVKNYITSSIVKLGHDKQAAAVNVYSRLLVDLMTHYVDMWDLYRYHICNTCPFLLPFNPLIEEFPGEEEAMRAVGKKDNEQIDLYIGRMGTCAQMYGMVLAMISKRQGFPVHVQSIGWDFLARTMCVKPENGVTAIILLNFLETAGFFLQQAYGKQFLKIMNYLSTEYMPVLSQVTEEGGMQAYTLMQNFMKKFNTTQKLKPNPLVEKS